jgi:hypothetical protein
MVEQLHTSFSFTHLSQMRKKIVPELEKVSKDIKELARTTPSYASAAYQNQKAAGIDFILERFGEDLAAVETPERAYELFVLVTEGHQFAPGSIEKNNPGIVLCARHIEAYLR